MSQKAISPKEIEVTNFFSKLGYFTRCHLQIFPLDMKNSASDIDVLSIKFDKHLNQDKILAEVKEGHGKISELFQLFGFKTYFRQCSAYLICKEVLDTTLKVSKKLDIRAITFERLTEIVVKDLNFESKNSIFVELLLEDVEKIIENLGAIKEAREDLYWKYHYLWLEVDPYKRFYQYQFLFAKAQELLEGEQSQEKLKALNWYKQELFCLSLTAAIEIAFDCININQNKLAEYIQDKFYNIGTSKEGKLKIKKGIDTLVDQIAKLSDGKLMVSSVEIIPGYVSNLVLLIEFLIRNSPYVQSYLLMDSNLQKINLKGKSKNFREFALQEIQSKRIEELNVLLLKILYDGRPIKQTFEDFV